MIYTVTFNPSLDYIVRLDEFVPGMTNRTRSETMFPGGKGINVSIVLHNLGIPSIALGFVAGFTGDEIERGAQSLGVNTDFIHLEQGVSRINVKIKADYESEINCRGPEIPDLAISALFDKLDALGEGDILVLSGSIPPTAPDDIYERILERLQGRGVAFVVDATKDLLLKVLKYHPFLIKPNNHELAEMFGVTLKGNDDIALYARKLQDMGAQNVLVSMAGDGAIFLSSTGFLSYSPVPKGKVKNSVGAGDSMVAGFLAGYAPNLDLLEGFKMGVATGSASAFSEGMATQEYVLRLLATI